MITNKSIRKLFQLYIGKHFSKEGRKIFGRWLRAETNRQEKEDQLQQFWLSAEGKITAETNDDWEQLRKQIHPATTRKLYILCMKYAAVVALFILCIGSTYHMAVQHTLRQPTEMAEIFVPYGESKEIVLPDQSKVWLNAGSTLIYAKSFDDMPSRSIYLTGEASFSVTKDKDKPFIVKTPKMNVEALGTVFTVEAYSNELYTTATLEEGKVRIDVNDEKSESHILYPNDQLIYSHVDGTVSFNKVDLSQLDKKRKGYLIFQESSFLEIISTIERKYGVTFQYTSSRYINNLYNLKFAPSESIENVMEILHQLIGIDYKIIDKSIIIK